MRRVVVSRLEAADLPGRKPSVRSGRYANSTVPNVAALVTRRPAGRGDRGRRRRAAAAPPGERRSRVRRARRALVPRNAPCSAIVRGVERRGRGGRPGDVGRGRQRALPVRGPVLAAYVGLHDPDQPCSHARRARGPVGSVLVAGGTGGLARRADRRPHALHARRRLGRAPPSGGRTCPTRHCSRTRRSASSATASPSFRPCSGWS
jgi:hypothetical protein